MEEIPKQRDKTAIHSLDQLLTVSEVALFLQLKPSTIYQWVSMRQIPYLQIGKNIRFRKRDLMEWLEAHTVKPITAEEERKVREFFKPTKIPTLDLGQMVKKSIAEVKGNRYTPSQEKPGKDKGLGKEGDYGLVS